MTTRADARREPPPRGPSGSVFSDDARSRPSRPSQVNAEVADRLEEVAELLQARANPFRVAAYRHAAVALRAHARPVSEIVAQEGEDGLRKIPGIGGGLARSIHVLVETGRLPLLDRLRSESDPVDLLTTVPGIGPRTARRLHEELGIETLEDLEAAAADGRLAASGGIRDERLEGILEVLSKRLRRLPITAMPVGGQEPSVGELLGVDAEYRARAAAGTLPRIAPRRFNPSHEAWLPVLHTERGPRRYTALWSNTSRAHALGRTRDWVVLVVEDGVSQHRYTVVTGRRGPLGGRRVVRGRERECVDHLIDTAAGLVGAA